MVRDEDIRQQLMLGEDSMWEFMQVKFDGHRPVSPKRDDLAAEMVAFANGKGGRLLVGVADDGSLQGLSRKQMDALVELLDAVGSNGVKPALCFEVQRRKLDSKALILVVVLRGNCLHEYKGKSWKRVATNKRRLTDDESVRLAQRRAQRRSIWFDEEPVSGTGFNTLDPALWRPILSTEGLKDPEAELSKLALLAEDESGVQCATVAGLLLCTRHPERWLPGAVITAEHHWGIDRATGQVDAQEITGPLQQQIAGALNFVVRNMRVAARKTPARIDMPQYSEKAVFEAAVNAVAHRDYSIQGRKIRLSMFSDRLEFQSPGVLSNSLTIEGMSLRQATRNQVVASAMGRIGVGDIRGSSHRRHFMKRRGDGVLAIIRETQDLSGRPAEYRMIDHADVLLRIPAAPQDATSARAVVTIGVGTRPLPRADIVALFPNGTWKCAVSDKHGEAIVDLYTAELPMTVYGAALGYAACLVREWLPATGGLALKLAPLPRGGSVIFTEGTGRLPGLRGRLNPIRDAQDRTYLYTSNIAVDRGRPQPVHFALGEELRLTDSDGVMRCVRIVEIIGRSALVEYWAPQE